MRFNLTTAPYHPPFLGFLWSTDTKTTQLAHLTHGERRPQAEDHTVTRGNQVERGLEGSGNEPQSREPRAQRYEIHNFNVIVAMESGLSHT